MASISAQRALSLTQRSVERSMRVLATGSRFADAGADASGQAIADNMQGQIKGFKSARYNAENAMSFVQVAEGSLNEQNNILIRLRELAVQAASDTLGDDEREFLNYEARGLVEEFDRIAKSTKFGSQALLDGTSKNYEFQVGVHSGSDNIIKYAHDTNTTASKLDVKSIDVGDKSDARDSLEIIDEAIVEMGRARAKLGAIQSRMESATNNIDTQIENLTDAHSKMADGDIAAEVSNVRRGQILQQYQASMLAAANESKGYMLRLIA